MLTPILFALLAEGATPPAVPSTFGPCLAELRAEAASRGVGERAFDRAMQGLQPDPSVIEAMQQQPEFETPVWEYLARLVDERRIAEGQARLAAWSPMLARAEDQFGVDRYTLVAVWGVESDYGRIMGQRPLLRSLATAACFGERQGFFRGEFVEALRIVQAGDIKARDLRGSWAGAFGHAQFMPSTYQRFAIDFDGDGKRDLVNSIPDALGSVGKYFQAEGWQRGRPWGYEVRLPAQYKGPSGRHARLPLYEWAKLGIVLPDGKGLVGEGLAALLLPAGMRGPSFIVFKNFDVIYAYNRSESYALAIAHLADRLRGGGPIQASWPTDDPVLARAERIEVQQKLIERGYLQGSPDGIVGSRTVAAIKAYQEGAGLPADGYASARLLKALRGQ